MFGILPLSLSLSPRQLRLLTALGTGVLVGTALIIIIPEGVETLYEASEHGHGHHTRALQSSARSPVRCAPFPGSLKHDDWRRAAETASSDANVDLSLFAPTKYIRQEDSAPPQDEQDDSSQEPEDEDEDHHEPGPNPHTWVGLSLITGFILMYLIDTLPRHVTPSSQPQRFQISLNQFSLTRTRTSSGPEPPTPVAASHETEGRPSSTTLGLVIHAMADGIALGASSTTTSRLSFVIFLALMFHKAPAAFGLTAVLLKQGLSKRVARAHLIVFSLAAPVGALLTWGAAHILGFTSASISGSVTAEFATGVLLLFSAGTFLYVAVHTMQESGHGHGTTEGNGYVGVPMSDLGDMYPSASSAPAKREEGSLTDNLVTVVGMLVPLVLSFGHAH